MKNLTYSRTSLALTGVLVASLLSLGVALVLQHVFYLQPCPFCVLQRIALSLTALVAAGALVGRPGAVRLLSYAGAAASAAGLGFAALQLWKVYVPSDAQTCGEGLGTWLDRLWIADLAPWLFAPMGDCIQDAAALFGIPLPAYALVLFAGLGWAFIKAPKLS